MKEYKIAVRIDDVCPTLNWANFNKVMDVIAAHNIKPLLGVVPDNKDKKLMKDEPKEDFWDLMQEYQKSGIMLAQHGTDHVYRNKKGGILKINKQSEMVGESKDAQKEFYLNGKNTLKEHGIETDIFMAPSHSYDNNTLEALKEIGFQYITDGYTNFNYVYKGLVFVPCKNAARLWRFDKGIITLCLHPNGMSEQAIEEFDNTLTKYKDYLVDYSELLKIAPKKHFKLKESCAKMYRKIVRLAAKILRGRR